MAKNRIIGLIVLVLGVVIGVIILKSQKASNNSIKKVDDEKIAIMVYDENKKKYVKSDTYPVGSYKINTEDSYCANGSPLGTYDPKTGTMTTSLNKTDKCTYFFEKIKEITMNIVGRDAINGWNGSVVSISDYCKLELSTDGGNTYQTINYSNKTGDILTFPANSILRVTGLGAGSECYLKTCENSNCSAGDECFPTTDIVGKYQNPSTYTIQEKDAYITIYGYETCLVENTYVYYYDKKKKKKLKKKIKDIKENDLVYIVSDDEISYKKVKKVEKNIAYDIVNIYLENGEMIQSTYEHVFVANGLSYALAKELKENFELKMADGKYVKIIKIEKVHYDEGIEVYNLSFDGSKNTCIMIASCMILSAVLLSTSIRKVLAAGCQMVC